MTIKWQAFPKHMQVSDFLLEVIEVFEENSTSIHSLSNEGQASNEALAKITPHLQELGFQVELGKTRADKISVPVLFGLNGRIEKSFDADAYHPFEKVVLEVEAGRAVANYQFLKDLFQACVMQNVDHLVIAVRNDYRGSDDFSKVTTFLETIFSSNRLILPLSTIIIIGY